MIAAAQTIMEKIFAPKAGVFAMAVATLGGCFASSPQELRQQAMSHDLRAQQFAVQGQCASAFAEQRAADDARTRAALQQGYDRYSPPSGHNLSLSNLCTGQLPSHTGNAMPQQRRQCYPSQYQAPGHSQYQAPQYQAPQYQTPMMHPAYQAPMQQPQYQAPMHPPYQAPSYTPPPPSEENEEVE